MMEFVIFYLGGGGADEDTKGTIFTATWQKSPVYQQQEVQLIT